MIKLTLVSIVATGLLLSGCATAPKSVANLVCIQVNRMQPHEEGYLRRKVSQYLVQYGFSLATENCGATIRYEPFGAFQGESITRNGVFTIKEGYWSHEGLATYSHRGTPVGDELQVNLRGYSTNLELLDGLAWTLVKPVTKMFQPTAMPK